MNPKLKKLIAREGLIIIGLIFLIIVSFYLASIIPHNPISQVYTCATSDMKKYEVTVESSEALHYFDDRAHDEMFNALKKQFPNEFSDNDGFIPDLNIKHKRSNYTVVGYVGVALEWLGWALLFVGYPSYLLICFIIWAIKTLRSK